MSKHGGRRRGLAALVMASLAVGPAMLRAQPTEPAPSEPVPTEPAPTEPAPTEPASVQPAPTESAPAQPAPTEPASVDTAAAPGQMSTVPSDAVTRDEYNRLRAEMDAMKSRIDQGNAGPDAGGGGGGGLGGLLGDDRFLVTGYASAGYVNRRSESTFSAGFNPVFVFRINDRIFVEAELELELESEDGESSTESNLEYANINFIVNDYLTVRAGKFLTPFGQFPERLHPSWINKLPDFPLAYDEEAGLVPFSSLGVEVRGAVPVDKFGMGGGGKIVYAAYVANGPALIADSADEAGNLDFDNFSDNNDAKSVGGRLGFLPVAELEIGGSFQWGDVGEGADALLLGLDASYLKVIDAIGGTIDARVEWVWSRVDTVTFDESGAGGFGPLRYKNNRNGGYAQLAYRPTRADDRILRNLEGVVRFDSIHVPSAAPGAVSDTRLTLGVDYWLTPNVVLKAAYQFDSPEQGPHDNALLLQAAVGF